MQAPKPWFHHQAWSIFSPLSHQWQYSRCNFKLRLSVLALSSFQWITTIDADADGTSPRRLVETDKNFNIITEHSKDVALNANIFKDKFNPHGRPWI